MPMAAVCGFTSDLMAALNGCSDIPFMAAVGKWV